MRMPVKPRRWDPWILKIIYRNVYVFLSSSENKQEMAGEQLLDAQPR
jgi:hypothetical protein